MNRHSEETKQLILSEYEAGKNISQLYREYGVSEPTITKWLKRAGVEIRKTNGRELNLDAAKVNRMYNEGMSTYDIARVLSCSDETVRKLVEHLRPAIGRKTREETKEKLRDSSKQLWSDPNYRNKVLSATSTPEYHACD